jgi:hypothetical protein
MSNKVRSYPRQLAMWITHQCGSMRYAREAAVNVRLVFHTSVVINNHQAKSAKTHPTAPHDSVKSKTLIEGSFRNRSTTPFLSFCGTFPSKRRHGMSACLRPASTTSRVILHVENTTLLRLASADSVELGLCEIGVPLYINWLFRQIFQEHRHLRGKSCRKHPSKSTSG